MQIEIKNKSGEVIISGEYNFLAECVCKNKHLRDADLQGADLRGADLPGAYLRGADLQDADLRDADLRDADLRDVNLQDADLRDADLRDADLQGANLRGANLRDADLRDANLRDVNRHYALPDLYALKLQPPTLELHFWKYLVDGKSPYRFTEYRVGEEYIFDDADGDEKKVCAAGGNVATLSWCLKDSQKADQFIEVVFSVQDIVAIPFATDGKFRVRRFFVKREIDRKEALEIVNKAIGH